MTTKPQRAAIYARVSTDETRQNPETQLRQGAFPYFRSTYKKRAMLALTSKQG